MYRHEIEERPAMPTTAYFTDGQIRALTREEGLALLDREARWYLQMSAEAFIRTWEAGDFDDDPDRPDVMYVAMLLPFVQ